MKKIVFNFLQILIAVALAAVIYCAFQFVTIWASNSVTDVAPNDCLVVLGAAVWEGGRPSPVFGDRLTRAAELYHAGAARKIIVSGSLGKNPPAEAEAGRQLLIANGVADADIIRELEGATTAEQAARVLEICRRENFQKIAVVTSFFHERRALQIFRRAGFENVSGARCVHLRFEDINWWIFRESVALSMMNWWLWAILGLFAGGLFARRRKRAFTAKS